MKPKDLELRVAKLEARMEAVERTRSGRKGKPVIVSVEHVCGVDPSIDSATCPHFSLYRRQQGCRGDACVARAAEYYREYRQERAG